MKAWSTTEIATFMSLASCFVAVFALNASPMIDLFDNWLAGTETLSAHGVEPLFDVTEFVFLQLYLLGLAFAAVRKPATSEVGAV